MDGKLAQLYIILISDKYFAYELTFFFSSYLLIFLLHIHDMMHKKCMYHSHMAEHGKYTTKNS